MFGQVLELVVQVELELATLVCLLVIIRSSQWEGVIQCDGAKGKVQAETEAGIMVKPVAKFP